MRSISLFITTLIYCAALLSSAIAQPGHSYVIGAEDVLQILVTNHEELNNIVTVQEDGTITMAEVGTIQAAGKTQTELAATIKTALSKTRNRVEVNIGLKEIHSHNVRILGAVKLPGAYELHPEWRVMDLVDAAGGPAQKFARVSGKLVRNRSQVIPLDLTKADAKRDSDYNMPLTRDDEIILDEVDIRPSQIFVTGCVNKQGQYEIDDQSNALSVITQAGGPAEKASLANAYITRAGVKIPMDLSDIVNGKLNPQIATFKFQSGDWLFVPENQIHFAVMGQVSRPGFYPMPDKGQITVVDALNLAGGSAGGNGSKAVIVRSVDGKATAIPVNVPRLFTKAEMDKNNILLQANDILYIPPSSNHAFNWTNVLAPFTALGILGLHL